MDNSINLRGLTSNDHWDYENGSYWFSEVSRINKMLAYYELYQKIISLPGHIFELGVYKGASLIRFATFRNLFENDLLRKIVGFDAFGEFPTDGLDLKSDINFVKKFVDDGGDGLAEDELRNILSNKGFKNIELVERNVFDTIPKYLDENPETKLSILHLDMDVKEPTDYALEQLYDKVVPGGLIILDGYNSVEGETISVDTFIKKHRLRIHKLPFYNVPSYITKPT